MASLPPRPSECPENGAVHRLCAYELCRAMEDLRLCARCRGTWYCSREHQKQHWREHKKSCKISNTGMTGMPKKEQEGKVSRGSGLQESRDSGEESNKVREVESTKVQEDIEKFSANIRWKHSCILTPCEENEDEALTQTLDHKPDAKKFSAIRPDEISQERENMPPNQPAVLSPKPRGNTSHALFVSEHMRKFGICVVDKFLKQETGDAILEEVMLLRNNDAFSSGQLVTSRMTGSTSSKDIRGDMITWTDGHDPETKNIGFLISKIDLIVRQCKGLLEGFKNINGRSEAMVACYPGNGAHYVKHVDNPNEDGRCITCIYYLNKDWDSKKMGGSLRLYPRSQDVISNVDPIFNRLIFFWSDLRNPHEVLPAFNTRYAITVWYFDDVERKKALANS